MENTETNKSGSLFDKSKFFTGGNFGLLFGNTTFINASPIIGYQITEKVQAGIGIIYLYYRVKNTSTIFEAHTFGGRVFSRQYLYGNLFAYQELELINGVWALNEPRSSILNLFIGAGYTQVISTKLTFSIMGLYNLTESKNSPYANNPMLRVGGQFAF